MVGTNILESGKVVFESGELVYERASVDMFDRSPEHPELYSIYQGEAIKSLRTILRRFTHVRNITPADDPAGATSIYYYGMGQNRYPLYYRYDLSGIDTANVAADPINFVKSIPFNHVACCFIGSRGSMNWRFQLTGCESMENFQVQRKSRMILTAAEYNKRTECSYTRTATTQAKHRTTMVCTEDNFEGALITDQRTQTGVTVSVPYYSMYKFRMNDVTTRTLGSSVDGSDTDTMLLSLQFNNPLGTSNSPLDTCIQSYVAIGADFNFVHFLNVPVMQYGNVPAATV
jgi:hypothetical protein